MLTRVHGSRIIQKIQVHQFLLDFGYKQELNLTKNIVEDCTYNLGKPCKFFEIGTVASENAYFLGGFYDARTCVDSIFFMKLEKTDKAYFFQDSDFLQFFHLSQLIATINYFYRHVFSKSQHIC